MTESRMALSRFLERYGIWLVVLVMMFLLVVWVMIRSLVGLVLIYLMPVGRQII